MDLDWDASAPLSLHLKQQFCQVCLVPDSGLASIHGSYIDFAQVRGLWDQADVG